MSGLLHAESRAGRAGLGHEVTNPATLPAWVPLPGLLHVCAVGAGVEARYPRLGGKWFDRGSTRGGGRIICYVCEGAQV